MSEIRNLQPQAIWENFYLLTQVPRPSGHLQKIQQFLLDYIRHDKKNVGGQTNFTLLAGIGQIRLDCHASREQICEALDFLREG